MFGSGNLINTNSRLKFWCYVGGILNLKCVFFCDRKTGINVGIKAF